jgi:hypothetical protein
VPTSVAQPSPRPAADPPPQHIDEQPTVCSHSSRCGSARCPAPQIWGGHRHLITTWTSATRQSSRELARHASHAAARSHASLRPCVLLGRPTTECPATTVLATWAWLCAGHVLQWWRGEGRMWGDYYIELHL